MRVSSAPPLVVASFVWQPRTAAFVSTVICKATYELRQGVSPLVMAPSAPLPEDLYWAENRIGSVHTPGDFAPFKRHVDVLLGGHAYTPPGQASEFFVARLAVGTINKAIAVHGDRHWRPDGRLSEPVPFTKMPLRWERAAGGPTTWNPVGVPASKQGQWPAPNLEPVGFRLQSPMQLGLPIGFGALAPYWPTRAEHLKQHGRSWVHETWYERPLPPDVDAAYFNVAPFDQQIAKLPSPVQVVLVHLHPRIPRLSTVLEDVYPVAVVTRSGGAPQEISMRCDTLFVDTDRGTCTLTWRASVPLKHPQEDLAVIVNATRGGASEQAPLTPQSVRGQTPPQRPASTRSPGITPPVVFSELAAAPTSKGSAKQTAPIPLDIDDSITLDGPALLLPIEDMATLPASQGRVEELELLEPEEVGAQTLAQESQPSASPSGPVLPFKGANSIPVTEAPPAPRAPNYRRTATLVPGPTPATSPPRRRPTLPFMTAAPRVAPGPEPSAAPPAPVALEDDGRWSTLTARDVAPTHTPALPFVASSPTAAPWTDGSGGSSDARPLNDDRTGGLGAGFMHPTTSGLPFKTAPQTEVRDPASMSPLQLTPPPSSPRGELAPAVELRPLIDAGSQDTRLSSGLPFRTASPPAATPPATAPSEGSGEAAAERVERKPGKASLSIEQYARIKMQLWGAHASLSEVLERHGIDEVEWRIHERRQADALAAEEREGRCDLALALMAAFEASQAQSSTADLFRNERG
ncbi:MAG TPA: DUF2169 domain-containing protein [Polyangiaceae bacterium]|nr:DUF2169 domain-containing protein [Polyangiaceae bacterium]